MYDLIKRDSHKFDTSDYPADNVYGISRLNNKVLGLMKDENHGVITTEFVGLRSKMFAYRRLCEREEDREKKRLKGIKRTVISKRITFNDYLECLRTFEYIERDQRCIRSDKHRVYSITESKVALSPSDTKRYLIPNSTDTLPWGHYAIPENNEEG